MKNTKQRVVTGVNCCISDRKWKMVKMRYRDNNLYIKKVLLYLVVMSACIGTYVGLYFFYIPNQAQAIFEARRDSLETSIKRKIHEVWKNDKALLYFKDYGGAKYLRMDMDAVHLIDSKPNDDYRSRNILAWDLFPNGRYPDNVRMAFKLLDHGAFDDLNELYYIQYKPWFGTKITPDKDYYNIKVFTYTPLFVGYKKESIALRSYRPSFDKCCQEAKEYIQEDDANNRMYYSPHNERRVRKIFSLHNDYYYYQFYNIYDSSYYIDSYISDGFDFADFNFYSQSMYAFPNGTVNWVYNFFYKLYYFSERIGTMRLTFNDAKYSQDVESYISGKRAICNMFLYVSLGIMFFFVTLTFYKHKRSNEQVSSTTDQISSDLITGNTDNVEKRDTSVIYESVIKLSNPELFIKPYQPEKLETANRIYSTALKNRENVIILEKLLEEAIKL